MGIIEEALLEEAKKWLHVREVSPNRGPEIDRWVREAGLDPAGQHAYCACAVTAWLKTACAKLGVPMPIKGSFRVRELVQQLHMKGLLVAADHVVPSMLTRGRLFLAQRGGPGSGLGHVGVLSGMPSENGMLWGFGTIEANVSDIDAFGFGREVEGVLPKCRSRRDSAFIGIGLLDEPKDVETLDRARACTAMMLDQIARGLES